MRYFLVDADAIRSRLIGRYLGRIRRLDLLQHMTLLAAIERVARRVAQRPVAPNWFDLGQRI